jgi:hypothetical protein
VDGGSVSGWTDFLVATAGAASALAGLVFVALSINLSRIIEIAGVTSRAAETVILLSAALVGALVALVPGQSPHRLGAMLLVIWFPAWLAPTIGQLRELAGRKYQRLYYSVSRVVLHQGAMLPLLLAGLSLWGVFPGGLQWFALAVVLSMVAALVNAWVLLVEILR